ncbi:MAG TPA: tRNA (adenosine(37)-N6)-dimethylallyltransferase MiaA, partial [Stenomitos sp.]
MQPALIVICGPTATGKSNLALAIAERLTSPILSADSRQVYQEFDIGTAKPTLADQARVPHHLIDICPPTSVLTVAEYQTLAQDCIASFHQQGVVPILAGGTGLYVQAVAQGLGIPRVPAQPQLRSQLEAIAPKERHQWLQQVDAASATKIHPNDQVRTLRALEVYYATGIPLSVQQTSHPPQYPILYIGLDLGDFDQQTQRIHTRTLAMLDQGWQAEVESLMQTYGPELSLLNTLGYAELCAYIQGHCSLEEAIEQTVLHTRQFAKRQRTWFRANAAIQWFDANDSHLIE